MKRFSNYQYVGGEMSDRDKKEQGSKFWNDGKWNNFVLPFLPDDVSEMTLIDIGCNAGVFLKLAEDKGFQNVIGVDADKESYKKAIKYRKENGGKYRYIYKDMRNCINDIPMSDYIVMAMTHYYFDIPQWLKFMDNIHAKTANIIIVTASKREKISRAGSDTERIREYFKNWKETGYIPQPPLEGDPFPRKQWSFCFRSPTIDRFPIDKLDIGNHVQDGLYQDIDDGKDIFRSRYFRILKEYRRKKWSKERLVKFMEGKKATYQSVKENGLLEPIIINDNNRVVDGNHRANMMQHLGYKSVLVRRVK